jgi:hypothetical protein
MRHDVVAPRDKLNAKCPSHASGLASSTAVVFTSGMVVKLKVFEKKLNGAIKAS